MYTSYWPLINGESESGVTLHRIDYGIDTGDIIAQKTFELNERMTAKQLYLKYIETGIEIVNDNLKNLLNNNYFVRSQGYQNSTYYSKTSIDYKNISVLLKQTAFNIKNQIRALNFRDYQLPSINQHHVTHAIITGERSNVPAGDLIYEDEIKFKYSTIDYDIIIFKDHHDDILDVCRKGEMEILEEFYEFRYDLDDQNLLGWTPLIVACYNGQVEVVKYLLDKGVDVNKTNYNGTTPLMFAKDYCILNNDYEIIKILFRCGADASRKDYCGKDIFDYILEEYEVKIFEKIKELELMK
jgi:methionyl-tRNA formyltransferase